MANEEYMNIGLLAPDAWAEPSAGGLCHHKFTVAAAMITENVA